MGRGVETSCAHQGSRGFRPCLQDCHALSGCAVCAPHAIRWAHLRAPELRTKNKLPTSRPVAFIYLFKGCASSGDARRAVAIVLVWSSLLQDPVQQVISGPDIYHQYDSYYLRTRPGTRPAAAGRAATPPQHAQGRVATSTGLVGDKSIAWRPAGRVKAGGGGRRPGTGRPAARVPH